MNRKDIINEQKNLRAIQRIMYLVMGFYVVLLQLLNIEPNVRRTTIFIGAVFAFALIEEALVYFDYFENALLLSAWRYIQYIISVISLYAVFRHPYATVALLGFLILYMIEFIMAGDFFDVYNNSVRLIILFAPVIVFTVIMASLYQDYRWMYILFSYVILFIIMTRVMLLIARLIRLYRSELDIKNTALNETEDANQKLLDYQERMKTVNAALNLQKLDLERANDMIKAANAEISIQADIARFISGTFDMTKVSNKVLDGIMSSKTVYFCALYIDKDTYLNKHANCIVRAEDAALKRRLNRDLPEYYSHYKSLYADIIIDNDITREKYPFVGDLQVKSLILRPLNLNNTMYGILMVGNAQQEFTADNLAFYDAIISQMNIAVNNCRLYLQTQNMARKDGLTGINNRTYFTTLYSDTVKQVLEQKSSMCVALFDIDKFKRVNDTYGHLAGDEVIKLVAKTTEAHINEYNGYVCRYGGEEFVAVLPDRNVSSALAIINDLHTKIAGSVVEYGGERIGMNVSIGLTAYPEICDNPYDLLKRADWAMYYAKEHGRGQVKVDGEDVTPVN